MCAHCKQTFITYKYTHSHTQYFIHTASCYAFWVKIEKIACNRPEWQLVMGSTIFKLDEMKTHYGQQSNSIGKTNFDGWIDKLFVLSSSVLTFTHHQDLEQRCSPRSTQKCVMKIFDFCIWVSVYEVLFYGVCMKCLVLITHACRHIHTHTPTINHILHTIFVHTVIVCAMISFFFLSFFRPLSFSHSTFRTMLD